MSGSTRRDFLKTTGAAGATVGAAVAVGAASTQPAGAAAPERPAGASGAMVAHVPDVQGGEIVFMVEGRDVTVVDHELVTRLASAMHAASRAAAKASLAPSAPSI